MSSRSLFFTAGLCLVAEGFCSSLCAEEIVVPEETSAVAEPDRSFEGMTAPDAVREGNRLLLDGNAPIALKAYAQAKDLRPDAPEVPFVEGLAHYALGDYESARTAFQRAAASDDDRLAGDALYSIGTTYHAEALESSQDPQVAIEKLENAMQRYREVLADRPDHAVARDANYKAATLRRQIKQMLEQQQQQQQQDGECDNEKEGEDQQEQQNSSESQQEENEQDQQQQNSSESQEDQQQQQQSQDGDSEQQAQSSDSEEDQEQQQAQPESGEEEEERVSREQAERQLREMMQALRERQKERRPRKQPAKIAPVEKDW